MKVHYFWMRYKSDGTKGQQAKSVTATARNAGGKTGSGTIDKDRIPDPTMVVMGGTIRHLATAQRDNVTVAVSIRDDLAEVGSGDISFFSDKGANITRSWIDPDEAKRFPYAIDGTELPEFKAWRDDGYAVLVGMEIAV